ncbi:UvrD-like helicase C-terminal domain-containing protein [Prevotella sp. tc2-28]|uniref:ATP-dependent DNA helicase n=1 Tax=Prevotella sp. tc2-28 TaxID=1761888 RepID=UPI0008997FBE|nr:AAA family ATPase [Prevotella sp. tc2-28]SEA69381.1 UvrD-like helicase C-terminal domain-containing protein [Prevotella sp. tc2-28]
MIVDELTYRIRNAFGFAPTAEQERAIEVFTQFMTDRHEQSLMILRGSAGTGKTTLAAALVRALCSLQQKIVLLAPTGRAAKVFSLYAGHPAYTIHRRIYRQKSMEGAFNLNYNTAQDTLFIVDEASMVANATTVGDTPFANGQLLDDLIQFVYRSAEGRLLPEGRKNGRNCRMMLIGDTAQLPPVGEEESPALQTDIMRSYGLHVHECDLNEVLRQSQESGILWNATMIRQLITHDGPMQMPAVRFEGFSDIRRMPGDELIESLASSYSHVGTDETMVITRSNKRANIYNQGIRNMVLGREEELCSGDLLMIVKNNYYWTSLSPNLGGLGYIANGDRAIVRRVRHVEQLYGFRFAEVTMTFPDYDDYELTATVLLDTLTSEAPALTHQQQTQLYNQVMEDYADIPLKPDRLKKLREDRHYNALQIKFGYAATCHKAQGGQWAHVYVDQGYMTDDMLSADYIHWLYTAFTRATEQLYLVNWPTK